MNLPDVIFGTSSLGNLYVSLEDRIKREIVDQSIQHSSSPAVFDCAGKYGAGLALESLAKCLKDLNVKPEHVMISNKLGWYRVPLLSEEPTFEPGVWKDIGYDAEQRISYDGILACYQQGEELLNGYHADLVSVHDPDEYLAAAADNTDLDRRWQDILGAYRALFDLKSQGKVKAVGVGAKKWTVIKRITDALKLDWVMIANSMTLHSHPEELQSYMKTLSQDGVLIINSAVFNGGFLTGGDHYNYKKITGKDEAERELIKWREEFFSVCKEYRVDPAHACVQYARNVDGVKALALSTSTPGKVRGNVELLRSVIEEGFWTALKSKNLM